MKRKLKLNGKRRAPRHFLLPKWASKWASTYSFWGNFMGNCDFSFFFGEFAPLLIYKTLTGYRHDLKNPYLTLFDRGLHEWFCKIF
jgi:hypothetical protein